LRLLKVARRHFNSRSAALVPLAKSHHSHYFTPLPIERPKRQTTGVRGVRGVKGEQGCAGPTGCDGPTGCGNYSFPVVKDGLVQACSSKCCGIMASEDFSSSIDCDCRRIDGQHPDITTTSGLDYARAMMQWLYTDNTTPGLGYCQNLEPYPADKIDTVLDVIETSGLSIDSLPIVSEFKPVSGHLVSLHLGVIRLPN
jgi:hypothetical protein